MAISVGDVFTVFEDYFPPSQWRLGIVEQLIPGADNCVRAAVIKVITKSKVYDCQETSAKAISSGGRDQ